MQHKEYNDYELLYMVRENDENAYNLLYEKYKPLVLSYAKKYASIYQNYGIDINDFILEGYIGLDSSIKRFRDYDDHKFQNLVCTCVIRQMQNLIKQARLKRNHVLNNSLYYETVQKNQELDFLEIKEDENGINPEEILIDIETTNEVYNNIKTQLKGIELDVFKLRVKGYSNIEIAEKLNKTVKSVNNAITRIKKKYNKY